MTKLMNFNNKYYLDLFFVFCFLFTLPIAGVTAVQNISLLFFVISVFMTVGMKKFIYLKEIKSFIYIFLSFLFLAILSIFYSIDIKETISEIRGEVIKPFLVLIFFFIFIYFSSEKKIFYLSYIIVFILLVHSLINLYMWYDGGFWPFRAGGLLDNSGGERFGIWATYAIAIAIAIAFTKNKKLALFILFITFLSIIANNTRATFIAFIFILIVFFVFIYKNRLYKFIGLGILFSISLTFIIYSKNFETRYNMYNVIEKVKYIDEYTPSEFNKMIIKYDLGHSIIARLSMWKSIINYRINEPFIPLGYGRFLYKKQINEVFKDNPENIPYTKYDQPHSDFMSVLFSLGIFGLLAFLIFLYYKLKISYYIFQNSNKYKYISIFIFLGTIGYISSMIFGSFFGDSEQLYFYSLYGILLALYVKTKEENNEKFKAN